LGKKKIGVTGGFLTGREANSDVWHSLLFFSPI